MKTFVIQAVRDEYGNVIPAQGFGYTAIEAVGYKNWYSGEKVCKYVLNTDSAFNGKGKAYLARSVTPIGSVEYVSAWLEKMGVSEIRPLNIPRELWKFVKRGIGTAGTLRDIRGRWFAKSSEKIKYVNNMIVEAEGLGDLERAGLDRNTFMTQWVDDIVSEWRVFVFDGEVVGCKCYAGDDWYILPDKEYVEKIVKAYDKRCYTLDVIVRKNGDFLDTDVLELHDFFSVGLYGFEDFKRLPLMWEAGVREFTRELWK